MRFDNILHVLRVNMDIGRVVRHDSDDWSFGAKAEATRCHYIHAAA
jgi:hypothetical protein